MSQTGDAAVPTGDDPPAKPTKPKANRKKRRRAGLQVDQYGIKADLRPVEIGEQPPRDWSEVRDSVHAKLRNIVVGLVGAIDDSITTVRKFVRGVAEIPAAMARRIDRAHDRADRMEGIRQEKLEAKQLPPPTPSDAAARLEAFFAELQADGISVGEFEVDGQPVIFLTRPELQGVAGEVARRALEPSRQAPQLEGPSRQLLAKPIADLNLGIRARKAMATLAVATIGDLVIRTPDELLECKNFGVTSLNEVRAKLAALGLGLKDDPLAHKPKTS